MFLKILGQPAATCGSVVPVVCLVPYQISVGQAWFRCLLDAIAGPGCGALDHWWCPISDLSETGRPARGQIGRLACSACAFQLLWHCMGNLYNISMDLKSETKTNHLYVHLSSYLKAMFPSYDHCQMMLEEPY